MNTNNAAQGKPVSFPPLWPGHLVAIFFILSAIAIGIVCPQAYETEQCQSSSGAEAILSLVWFAGLIYWLVCVHRIHKALFKATGSTYPIRPGRAVGFHFIPFYNLYWIFKWPSEVVKFINVNLPQQKMSGHAPGILLLIGFIIGDGIGLFFLFLALRGMMRNIKIALEGVNVQGGA